MRDAIKLRITEIYSYDPSKVTDDFTEPQPGRTAIVNLTQESRSLFDAWVADLVGQMGDDLDRIEKETVAAKTTKGFVQFEHLKAAAGGSATLNKRWGELNEVLRAFLYVGDIKRKPRHLRLP